MKTKEKTMLDVEFLLNQRAFDRPLVYLYRSGALRPRMRKYLEEVSRSKGWEFSVCEPEQLPGALAGAGFWRAFSVCDLGQSARALSAHTIETALVYLASHDCGDCALFLSVKSPLIEHPYWPAAKAASLVIEEPQLSADTIIPILRYLEASTDLADNPSFLTQPGFLESFRELLEDKRAGLYEVMHAFDRLVLTQTDPKTNEIQQLRHSGSPSLQSGLSKIIAGCDPSALVEFILSLEERYRDAIALAADMYRITERGLPGLEQARKQRAGKTVASSANAHRDAEANGFLWAALMLVWEDRLIENSRVRNFDGRHSADVTIMRWEQMGREFLARAKRSTDDPLVGLWVALRRALMKLKIGGDDRLAANRAKMARTLANSLSASPERVSVAWLDKLLGCVAASLADSAAEENSGIDGSVLQ